MNVMEKITKKLEKDAELAFKNGKHPPLWDAVEIYLKDHSLLENMSKGQNRGLAFPL